MTSCSLSGVLRLRAERRGRQTVLTDVFRSAPFHIGMASYRAGDGTAQVIVQHVGPGVLPGDQLDVEISVGAGARLVVRGQSATKVYPSPPDEEAHATTRIHVAADGYLAWLPGPLIPFRDCALRQEVTADLATDGRLILAETVTPGRIAMGERDAYRWLDLRCRVSIAQRLVFVDRSHLVPHARSLANPVRHGPFECAGALYLFGFGRLDLGAGETRPDLWWRAGSAEHLTMVRYLGTTAQAITTAQDDAVTFVAHTLQEADTQGIPCDKRGLRGQRPGGYSRWS